MGYKILELENLPESLREKPRWVSCVAFTGAVLMITMSAVTVGILLGYTYCYIEHRTTVRTAGNNVTQPTFQILHMAYPDSLEDNINRTINGALMSRILQIGHVMIGDHLGSISFSGDEHQDIESFK